MSSNLLFKNFLLYILIFLFFACKSDPKYILKSTVNPSGICPLCSVINIQSEGTVTNVKYTVSGVNPVTQSYDKLTNNRVAIVGLYPNKLNKVLLEFDLDNIRVKDSIEIQTGKISLSLPKIEINKIDRSKMVDGFHACDLHLAQKGKYNSSPFIFDDSGVIRWYLDLSFHKKMLGPFQKMKNGNILVIGRHVLYELDMLGNILKKVNTSNDNGMHHDVAAVSETQLLIPIGKRGVKILKDDKWIPSDGDWIKLFDVNNNKIIKEWDLAEHLDATRDNTYMSPKDWLHMNGVVFDKRDSSMIISNRCQGVVKLGLDDKVRWILAPHKDWGNSGRDGKGKPTAPFLLTAVDQSGKAYNNEVQLGNKSAEGFDFPWSQHSPSLLPNGNLLLFDNGFLRNYDKKPSYSRAVEYAIDEKNMEVKQVWQYGKERGTEFFSMIISDVDYLPSNDNMLITSGFIQKAGQNSCKIVEVDKSSKEEVFEATIFYKNVNGKGAPGWGNRDIIYRSERMALAY